MADEEKKAPRKRAAAKPPETATVEKPKKVAAKKAAPAAAAPAVKPVAEKPAKKAAEKTVTVRQVGSPIGREGYQRATLKGLGLNKLNRVSTLEDTPSVRGMIARVKHLIRIETGV